MEIHNGKKRFTCAHCERGFFTKFNLQSHMKTHRNESTKSETDEVQSQQQVEEQPQVQQQPLQPIPQPQPQPVQHQNLIPSQYTV